MNCGDVSRTRHESQVHDRRLVAGVYVQGNHEARALVYYNLHKLCVCIARNSRDVGVMLRCCPIQFKLS